MINIKLEKDFLKEIDRIVSKGHYQSRTEYIREALRSKVSEARMKQIAEELSRFRGKAKRNISEEEYERVREEAFNEVGKMIKEGTQKEFMEKFFK